MLFTVLCVGWLQQASFLLSAPYSLNVHLQWVPRATVSAAFQCIQWDAARSEGGGLGGIIQHERFGFLTQKLQCPLPSIHIARQTQHSSCLTAVGGSATAGRKKHTQRGNSESFQMANTRPEVSKCLRWLQAVLFLCPAKGWVYCWGGDLYLEAGHRQLVMVQLCSRLCLLALLYFSLGRSLEPLMDAPTECQSSLESSCQPWV